MAAVAVCGGVRESCNLAARVGWEGVAVGGLTCH